MENELKGKENFLELAGGSSHVDAGVACKEETPKKSGWWNSFTS